MHKILQQRSLCQEVGPNQVASGGQQQQQAASKQLVAESVELVQESATLPAKTIVQTTTKCLITSTTGDNLATETSELATATAIQQPITTTKDSFNKRQASSDCAVKLRANQAGDGNKAISNKQTTKTLYTRRRIRSSIKRENSSSSSSSASSSSSSSQSLSSSSSSDDCDDDHLPACRTNSNNINDSDNHINVEQQTKEINQFKSQKQIQHFNSAAYSKPIVSKQASNSSSNKNKTKNKNKLSKSKSNNHDDVTAGDQQQIADIDSSSSIGIMNQKLIAGSSSSNKQLITNSDNSRNNDDCIAIDRNDDIIDMLEKNNKKQLSSGNNSSTKQQLTSLRSRYLLSSASRKRLTSLAMNIIGVGANSTTSNQRNNQIKHHHQQQHKSCTITSILDTTKDYSKDNSSIIVLKSPTNAMMNRNGANSYHRDSSDDIAMLASGAIGDDHSDHCDCRSSRARQQLSHTNQISDNSANNIDTNYNSANLQQQQQQQQQRHTTTATNNRGNHQLVKVSCVLSQDSSSQQQDSVAATDSTNANLNELAKGSGVNSNAAKRSIKFGKVLTDMTIISESTLGKFNNNSNSNDNTLDNKIDVQANEQTGPIKRENWDKNIEFLLAVVGFAVDLGNIWRFPYVCYKNGGGAFLIPYMIMFMLGGLPVFYLEMSLGQYYASGCLTVWKGICPLVKGIGYAMCIINFFTGLYYNTIISWAVYFLFESFTTSELPWTSCNNPWNTNKCRTIDQRERNNSLATNSNYTMITTMATLFDDSTIRPKSDLKSPADEYFVREVLKTHLSTGVDDLGQIRWPLASYLAIVFIFVYFAIWKGVKSTGKAVWITALLPYFVLIPLLIRGVFLEGASVGITYYLYPNWSKLSEIPVWIDAAKQVFFSLGPGFGTLLALSSYNKFNHNCFRDAVIAASVNCFTSFIAGFVIFSVLGYMATIQQQHISSVATDGPGLVFQVYPEALATMKGSSFWSILFFTMVISLGIDSTFGGLEAVITGLCDEYPRVLRAHRELFIGCLVIIIYICSLPTTTYGGNYVITVLDAYGTSLSLLFIVFLEAASVCWIFGVTRFSDKLEEMYGHRPGIYWRICWTYISPTLLLFIFLAAIYQETDRYTLLQLDEYRYPSWAVGLGWLMTASSLVCVPIYAIYLLAKTPGSLSQRFKKCITPIEISKLTHDQSDSSCIDTSDNQNEKAP